MPRATLNSTLLQAATYQAQVCLLELEFSSGAVYHYFRVPVQTYQELLRADSHGRYFNHCIRNHFAYVKIHPDPSVHGSHVCRANGNMTL